jgi:hypothetical protein
MTRNEVACTIGGIGLGLMLGTLLYPLGYIESKWTITWMQVIGIAIIFISSFIRKPKKEKTA